MAAISAAQTWFTGIAQQTKPLISVNWLQARTAGNWVIVPLLDSPDLFAQSQQQGYRYLIVHVQNNGSCNGRIVEVVLPTKALSLDEVTAAVLAEVQSLVATNASVSLGTFTGCILVYSPTYAYQTGLLYQNGTAQSQRIRLRVQRSSTSAGAARSAGNPLPPEENLIQVCETIVVETSSGGVVLGGYTTTTCTTIDDGPGSGGNGSGWGSDGSTGSGSSPGGGYPGGTDPDQTSVPNMPQTMPKQTGAGACVPASLAQVKLALCGGNQTAAQIEGEMDLYGIQYFNNIRFIEDGVPVNSMSAFVNHFFNTTVLYPAGNFQAAINAGYPIMIDVFSHMDGSNTQVWHSVVITGYNPSNVRQVYYLDPGTGTTQTGTASNLFANSHYAIPITGCK